MLLTDCWGASHEEDTPGHCRSIIASVSALKLSSGQFQDSHLCNEHLEIIPGPPIVTCFITLRNPPESDTVTKAGDVSRWHHCPVAPVTTWCRTLTTNAGGGGQNILKQGTLDLSWSVIICIKKQSSVRNQDARWRNQDDRGQSRQHSLSPSARHKCWADGGALSSQDLLGSRV